ncbi:hypothetical protein ACQBAU_08515 [Propionibacteriaceae bacterium Y2011]|uniref:hypothetical protein n=1 Tax=Microlunatus sp. Y2014 TaxID=3418488 RepID=UPI003B4A6268
MTPQVVGRAVSGAEALAQLDAIRHVAGWAFLNDDSSFADRRIDLRVLMGRRQVTDLHLVGLAARHKVRMATFDPALRESAAPADRAHVEVWTG